MKIEYDRPAGIYKLTITGIKPHTNMEVSLAREEYARKPAFWWSAVVGCVKNFIVVPLATPYFLTVPLDPFVGTQGVEIVGASGSRPAQGPPVLTCGLRPLVTPGLPGYEGAPLIRPIFEG